MDTLMLGRWQFGITTVYHFLFVPLRIGLAFLVAVMQTIYKFTVDRILVVITHRPEALSGMDAVLTLRDGRLEGARTAT